MSAVRVYVIAVNPNTKISPDKIAQAINIWQAVKERRAFNVRLAFRARWKEETNGQGL